jgi:Protein of unknown function (DUF2800)
MACPGSMVLEVGTADSSSIYADEGTAAHEVAAMCLNEKRNAVAYVGRVIAVGKRKVEVTDDMADHVQTYVDNIRDYAKGADTLLVEVRVNYAARLAVAKEEGFGTSDVVILHGDEIQVHDLKFGRGEEVDAENNVQMMLYALGALDEYDGLAGDFSRVRMVIHQPRIKRAPSEWSCSVEDLVKFAATARSAACTVANAEAEQDRQVLLDVYVRPGEKQCRWCKAKATCPSLRAEVAHEVFDESDALDDFNDASPVDVQRMEHDELAVSMAKANLIEGWLTAVRAEVERRLLSGTPVAGYKVVQGKMGNRSWTSKADAEEAMKGMRLKLDEMYDYSIISPTAAEKLLAKDSPRRWSKLQALIQRTEGKPSVAPLSDKRPALEMKPVADDFAEVQAFDDLA